MSVAVVVASGGFRFRGLRFCKAVQVGRRMLSYCEASSWQVFSTRVSKHHMFSPLTLVKFFCLESVLVQIYLAYARTRTGPGFGTCVRRPPLRDLYLRNLKPCARTIVALRALATLERKLVPSHKQKSQTVCSYVVWNAVPSHT